MTAAPRRRPDDLTLAALAAALFVPLFVFRSAGPLDFWWWMSASLAVLIGLGLVLDRASGAELGRDMRRGAALKAAVGILSAAVLYGVFFAGNLVSRKILPFAAGGIGRVYEFRGGASDLRIALLMLLVIGPGEEIFWRGFLQRRWQERFGPVPGWLAAVAIYTFVHAGSGNPMLVLAAAVCGLFWGWLYLRTRSILLVAVSHTVWDLLVFVVAPFGGR